jgi:hypothetical protein
MKYYKLLFLCALGLLINCKSVNTISSTQIIESTENSITLDVKAANPEYVAVNQLLFRGFPNSNQTIPLISTSEIEIQKQFPTYFKDLFQSNRYKSFITSSTKNSNGSHRITINLKAIRLDLEQNSIIRKFGY